MSWQLLRTLEEEYGPAFYILDVKAFQDNYHTFVEAFRRIYPRTSLAYSYKTNYTPKLCQCVNAMGGYAEVVSSMEYDLALRLGVPPQRIIFNGPYKRRVDIERALLAGSIVNLDSSYEVALVEAVAQRSPDHTMTVGLRCNFDIGTENISRFGFDVEGEEFRAAFTRLARLQNCRVGGLHCHFSTGYRSVESYALRTRKMLELVTFYFSDNHPDFINLGGGFFSKMSSELQKQFTFPIPNYQEYAEAIAPQIAHVFPHDSGPELILEPGSAIVADVMQFATKIVDIKSVRSRILALASGSVHNIKPTLHQKNLPMRVVTHGVPDTKRSNGTVDIIGYTCMEHDYLYNGYEGNIAVDDYVIFDNVGAYTIVMKPPFILPSPPIIAYNSATERFEIIKRREEIDDIFSTYVFS